MKKLIEMTSLVTRKQVSKIELLDRAVLSKGEHKLAQLFDGIKDGVFKTDEDAAVTIYGTNPSDSRYRNLKYEYKKRIENNLFLLDLHDSGFTDYARAKYSCYRNLMLCRILGENLARFSVVDLAKGTLTYARKYQLTEEMIWCAQILRDHAFISGKGGEYDRFQSLIDEQRSIRDAEERALIAYQRIVLAYTENKVRLPDLAIMATTAFEGLPSLQHYGLSYVFQYYYHLIWGFTFQFRNDYKGALGVFEHFENFLERRPVFKQVNIEARINTMKLDCFLHLNNFADGERVALETLALYDTRNANRYVLQEIYCLLCIRSKRYGKAFEILMEVMGYAGFEYLQERTKEFYRILQVYLFFLAKTGHFEVRPELEKRVLTFDSSGFINHVPTLQKDKRGYNVSILVIQVLFLLAERDFGRIIDRMEALQVYRNRYLKEETELRSRAFIKLLLVMEKQSFDYDLTVEKTRRYFEEMQQHQFKYEGSATDAEVVPYETLWQMVLEILQQQ